MPCISFQFFNIYRLRHTEHTGVEHDGDLFLKEWTDTRHTYFSAEQSKIKIKNSEIK